MEGRKCLLLQEASTGLCTPAPGIADLEQCSGGATLEVEVFPLSPLAWARQQEPALELGQACRQELACGFGLEQAMAKRRVAGDGYTAEWVEAIGLTAESAEWHVAAVV